MQCMCMCSTNFQQFKMAANSVAASTSIAAGSCGTRCTNVSGLRIRGRKKGKAHCKTLSRYFLSRSPLSVGTVEKIHSHFSAASYLYFCIDNSHFMSPNTGNPFLTHAALLLFLRRKFREFHIETTPLSLWHSSMENSLWIICSMVALFLKISNNGWKHWWSWKPSVS